MPLRRGTGGARYCSAAAASISYRPPCPHPPQRLHIATSNGSPDSPARRARAMAPCAGRRTTHALFPPSLRPTSLHAGPRIGAALQRPAGPGSRHGLPAPALAGAQPRAPNVPNGEERCRLTPVRQDGRCLSLRIDRSETAPRPGGDEPRSESHPISTGWLPRSCRHSPGIFSL